MSTPKFLTREHTDYIRNNFEGSHYVYSESELKKRAQEFLDFPNAFGHTARYAMKANSNRNILKLFSNMGLHIDASSEYEALRAIAAGVSPEKIQISSQEMGNQVQDLIEKGVFFVATSLHQIEEFGKNNPGGELGVRINPGVGSADFKQINTGGWISSFGIWHEYLEDIKKVAEKFHLKITKIHIHIGSENTPASWVESANIGLNLVREFSEVKTLNMGGGFKMAIMLYEKTANLQEIGNAVQEKFEEFYRETKRKIHLEVEPGKYLTINTCSFVAEVIDIVDTGGFGYTFLRTNTGMNDMPRVPMYGIQEPIFIIPQNSSPTPIQERGIEEYVIVGHCCESSDILTCELHDQETIEPRELRVAHIGDAIVVDGVGSYNASMAMKHYNSFPESGELLLRGNGDIVEIRTRQNLEEIWKNEVEVI